MTDPSTTPSPGLGPSESGDAHEATHLLEYWRMLVRRRNVVFGCLAAVVGVTLIVTLAATPIYKATATVQIERQGPDILTFKDVLNVDPSGYNDFYQTQYKILESRKVLEIAADSTDLMNRPELVGRPKPPIARARSWVRSMFKGESAKGETGHNDEAIDFLAGGLGVHPIRKSYLVKVSFSDRDPELAAELANAVAEAYQRFNLDSRYETTAQASAFLTTQVADLQEKIAGKERQLQEYGASKQILDATDDTREISAQSLAELNAKYVDAQGRLAEAESRFRALVQTPPESLPGVMTNPLITSLKQRHAELERRHGQMSERFHEDWPALRELEQELERSQEGLDAEMLVLAEQVRGIAGAEYRRVQSELGTLAAKVEEQKDEVRRVKGEAIEYAALQNEIDTMRGFLTELVNRQSETVLSDKLKDTRTSNVRVVDAAQVPDNPVRPRKKLNLAFSIVAGLFLGIAAALLMDYLDYTVKNEQDIKRLSGLVALGHVPLFSQPRSVEEDGAATRMLSRAPSDVGSHVDPRSSFAEAFKSLRTSLLLASPEHPPRHIVVTSCEPGDGKSTVSCNLAIVLTQMGKRVLLIDADLRRPSVHRMLRLSNKVGLSSFLSGNAELEDLIQHTEIPNLRIITSGPIPPTPSELLGSSGLDSLMELQEQGRFDHIIFDSPPLMSVTDSMILSARMDSTIVVVRAGKTSREALIQGTQRMMQSRANVTGAVLNAVSEQSGYYYYGSPYGAEREVETQEPAAAVSGQRAGTA